MHSHKHHQGRKRLATVAVAAMLVSLATAGHAQSESATSFPRAYFGATVGASAYSLDCAGFSSCDDTDTGYKAYAGLRLMRPLAVEVSYIDFGKATGAYYYGYYYYTNFSIEAHAWTLSAAGQLSFTQNLTGIGRLGLANVTATETSNGRSVSTTSIKPYLGLGLTYAFAPHLRGVASADFTSGEVDYGNGVKDNGSMGLFSVGLQFDF